MIKWYQVFITEKRKDTNTLEYVTYYGKGHWNEPYFIIAVMKAI